MSKSEPIDPASSLGISEALRRGQQVMSLTTALVLIRKRLGPWVSVTKARREGYRVNGRTIRLAALRSGRKWLTNQASVDAFVVGMKEADACHGGDKA